MTTPAQPRDRKLRALVKHGREQERARIVAWLRAADLPHDTSPLEAAADAIERGDHEDA